MDLETFLGIVCLVCVVVCRIVIRYCTNNVYLRYAGDKKRRRLRSWNLRKRQAK